MELLPTVTDVCVLFNDCGVERMAIVAPPLGFVRTDVIGVRCDGVTCSSPSPAKVTSSTWTRFWAAGESAVWRRLMPRLAVPATGDDDDGDLIRRTNPRFAAGLNVAVLNGILRRAPSKNEIRIVRATVPFGDEKSVPRTAFGAARLCQSLNAVLE